MQPLSNLLTRTSTSHDPFHDSHPYIKTDITMLFNYLSFICVDISCSFQTLDNVLNAAPVLPILMPTSFLISPSLRISQPRYTNFSTYLKALSSISTSLSSSIQLFIFSFLLVLTLSSTLLASHTSASLICLISLIKLAKRQISLAYARSRNLLQHSQSFQLSSLHNQAVS